MPMALYPMRGQRANFTPPPLPMRSLSLHAQAAGDRLKAGASAGEAPDSRPHRWRSWPTRPAEPIGRYGRMAVALGHGDGIGYA